MASGVLLADIYQPDQWHDFFIMVGTSAATLTGLVFLAMSMNLSVITEDPTHRNRAIGNLTGLAAVFMLCGFVLIGNQNHIAVGLEILAVAVIAGVVFVSGYLRARRSSVNSSGLSLFRTVGGTACYLVEVAGAIVLILGFVTGLYMATAAIVANFYFMISGTWLLFLGARSGDAASKLAATAPPVSPTGGPPTPPGTLTTAVSPDPS
jgi:hypothetical protein